MSHDLPRWRRLHKTLWAVTSIVQHRSRLWPQCHHRCDCPEHPYVQIRQPAAIGQQNGMCCSEGKNLDTCWIPSVGQGLAESPGVAEWDNRRESSKWGYCEFTPFYRFCTAPPSFRIFWLCKIMSKTRSSNSNRVPPAFQLKGLLHWYPWLALGIHEGSIPGTPISVDNEICGRVSQDFLT